jgi:hypothetical protein
MYTDNELEDFNFGSDIFGLVCLEENNECESLQQFYKKIKYSVLQQITSYFLKLKFYKLKFKPYNFTRHYTRHYAILLLEKGSTTI